MNFETGYVTLASRGCCETVNLRERKEGDNILVYGVKEPINSPYLWPDFFFKLIIDFFDYF